MSASRETHAPIIATANSKTIDGTPRYYGPFDVPRWLEDWTTKCWLRTRPYVVAMQGTKKHLSDLCEQPCWSILTWFSSEWMSGSKAVAPRCEREKSKTRTWLRAVLHCFWLSWVFPILYESARLEYRPSWWCTPHMLAYLHRRCRCNSDYQFCHWTIITSCGAPVRPEHNHACTCNPEENRDDVTVEIK